MNTPSILALAVLLTASSAQGISAPDAASHAVIVFEPGDSNSSTLTRKAWAAFEAGNLGAVFAYTGRCRALFQDEALAQQKALPGPIPSTELERIRSQYALNDVGTCLFILGQALEREGKLTDALAVYEFLLSHFSYAQCWDNNGWYWFPADSARTRIRAIEDYVPRV